MTENKETVKNTKTVQYFYGSALVEKFDVSTEDEFRNAARRIIADLRDRNAIPVTLPLIKKSDDGEFTVVFSGRPWEGARADYLFSNEWYTASVELLQVVENLMSEDEYDLWLTVANRRGASSDSWDQICSEINTKSSGMIKISEKKVMARFAPLAIVEQVILQLVNMERGVSVSVDSNPLELPRSTIVWKEKP